MATRVGVLLVNLGTPDAPTTAAVRRYLREFLMDPRVIDLPLLARALLVHGIIAPFRAPRSARAYQTIWTQRGSPLAVHTHALAAALAERLALPVEVGMRYGSPSIAGALDRLVADGVEAIVAVPLFPQHASASWGSAAAAVLRAAEPRWNVPAVAIVPPFFDHPAFVDAVRSVTAQALASLPDVQPAVDHVLFSFHGVPERHCRRSDPSGAHCLRRADCCDALVDANRHCYRAQCAATARSLAAALGLAPQGWSFAFQSRLGRIPWIGPYTDVALAALAREHRHIAVVEPSFVADCLETIEEIGIHGRAAVERAGSHMTLVPCLNADAAWVEAMAAIVTPHLVAASPR